MLTKIAFSVAALAMGVGFAAQSGINAGLAREVGSSVVAAVISFGVGFLALIMLALASGQLSALDGGLRGVPLWMWVSGGLIGAAIVYGSVLLVPRIGVAALATLIIAGQLTAAVVIDHFGIFGVPVHQIGLLRVLGIGLLFAGALLVRVA